MAWRVPPQGRRTEKGCRKNENGGTPCFQHKNRGQSFLEFSFGIVMAVLLMMGLIEVFIWAGADQVKQLERHDSVLKGAASRDARGALKQVRPVFFQPDGFRDSVTSDVYGNVEVRFRSYIK